MVGLLIALVQLSTPYALENGGWSSAFLLVGLGMICAHTSHILGKCMQRDPTSRHYEDIGQTAFGSKGRITAATFMDLSSISFLLTVGVLMSFLIFVTVSYLAISGAVKANHAIPILKIENIPAISGVYIYSYAGHYVFPNIYKGMKDPTKFTKVSIVSFSLVIFLYTSLAFMGAKLFGPQVNSLITLSMPKELIVTKFALWAVVLVPMTKYALSLAPIAIQLEQYLPHSMTKRAKMIIRGSVGSILLLVILVLALSVPYFEHLLSLTGSLVSVGICVILPCTFYIKIFRNQISRSALILNVAFTVVGVLLGTSGTISSSRRLLENLRRDQSS